MSEAGLQAGTEGPAAFQKRFNVSRETVAKLDTYASLLRQWQKTINLVSPATLDTLWSRHVADSAQLVALAPKDAKRWADLGSGAGFPGLVLAIMLSERPGFRMTLVESDSRKIAFLREVSRQVGLSRAPSGSPNSGQDAGAAPVDIWQGRIESPSTHARVGTVDVVTARALAPLRPLLGLCEPFFGPDTVALLLKGRDVERELEEARLSWRFEVDLRPSVTDADARIAVVTGLQARGAN